jgi:hypothetical protein
MPTVLDMLPGKTHNSQVKVPSKRSFSVIGFFSSKIDKNIWSCWQNFLGRPLSVGANHEGKKWDTFFVQGSDSKLRGQKLVRAPNILTVVNGTAREVVLY